MGLLDGLEPEPVVREPVLGVVLDDADELLARERLELGHGVERLPHHAACLWSFTNFCTASAAMVPSATAVVIWRKRFERMSPAT